MPSRGEEGGARADIESHLGIGYVEAHHDSRTVAARFDIGLVGQRQVVRQQRPATDAAGTAMSRRTKSKVSWPSARSAGVRR